MIVDTSALVSILRGEREADDFLVKLHSRPGARISAGSWIELGAVLSGYGNDEIEADLLALVQSARLIVAPVTADQAEIGRKAYRQYGKGHHPARLNFGDCFAYALAKATGEPLLFKGDDFSQTDVTPA